MKKGFLVLAALYLCFAVYSICIFFYGKSGYRELEKLTEYRDRLEANNVELLEAGNSLYREAQILVSDAEILALKARELGYLKENQGVIYFSGYESREQSYALGKVLKWNSEAADRSALFRTLAIGLGLVAALLILLAGKRPNRRRN